MEDRSDVTSDKQREIPFQLLTEITNNFAKEQKLGHGTFGEVYKGVFKDGQVIAVKKLRFQLLDINDKQFKNEYELLSRLKHKNVVKLVGFCNETTKGPALYEGKIVLAEEIHRAICLEFVPNGSLGTFLSEQRHIVNWNLRFKIIKGICEGLEYLHDVPLNHLDLKPDNILLDDKMVPKIADFGTSRLVGTRNTVKTLTPLGTRGYMPPEFINKQIISREFDIFSLGVIIRKIVIVMMDDQNIAFVDDQECIEQVHSYWKIQLQGMLGYASAEADSKQVRTCIEISVACMDEDPRRRPTMKYIVRKLNKLEAKENVSFPPIEQFQDGLPKRDIPEGPSLDTSTHIQGGSSTILSTLPKDLPFNFFKAITDNFSDERLISQSAFGNLYKGIMPDGTLVAVKKLVENSPVPCDIAFSNEVQNIMGLDHKNIVKLVGFCMEGQKKAVWKDGRYIIADVLDYVICYKYLSKGSLDKNLSDSSVESNEMDWNTRFKVIKGICQGLHFLHKNSIIHMDLKPQNILLDDDMEPKIAEFGISRFLGQEVSRLNTQNVVGTYGYIAPEYLYRGEMSTQSDIYALGLLIMETTTGKKNNSDKEDPYSREYINEVRNTWTDTHIASKFRKLDVNGLQEVKQCILVGLDCAEIYRPARPSIENIIARLYRHPLIVQPPHLIVQPPQLRFPFQPKRSISSFFEPKRSISCSLSLTNTRDFPIAFRLLSKKQTRYLRNLPLSGVVPPKCIYTVNVTMFEQKQQPSRKGEFLTLLSSRACEQQLTNQIGSIADDEVKEVKLPVVCDPQEGTSSNQSNQSAAEIIASQNCRQVLSVDVHPNKPWILASNRRGNVCIWNYQTQEEEKCFQVGAEEEEPGMRCYRLPSSHSFHRKLEHKVYSATFIEREEWLVAGGGDGYIYVYSYDTMEEIESFKAHHGHHIRSLAASPTHSFLLSASDDHRIKIWDWKSHWKCFRTFQGHGNCVMQVMFDPNDSTSFASASLDHTIKIWDIYSPTCNATFDGQPEGVLCVHYFTDQNQLFLLSGSADGAAKIWDPEKECCVSVLSGDAKSLNAICWCPDLRVVITGSLDGAVQIWKSTGTTYRLEKIFGFNLGTVNTIRFIKGLRRIVVGCEQGIAMTEINLPSTEAVEPKEDNNKNDLGSV